MLYNARLLRGHLSNVRSDIRICHNFFMVRFMNNVSFFPLTSLAFTLSSLLTTPPGLCWRVNNCFVGCGVKILGLVRFTRSFF
jgi:hypothetical protein